MTTYLEHNPLSPSGTPSFLDELGCDETALIVWAAVGQGIEDRPEHRIAFARAVHTTRSDLLRELMLPAGCDDAWLLESACLGFARIRGEGAEGAPSIPRRREAS